MPRWRRWRRRTARCWKGRSRRRKARMPLIPSTMWERRCSFRTGRLVCPLFQVQCGSGGAPFGRDGGHRGQSGECGFSLGPLRRADRPLRGPCAVSPFGRKGHRHNSLPRRPDAPRAGLALRSLPSGPRRVPEKSRGPRPCHRGRSQPYCRIFLCGGYSSVYLQRTIGKRGRRQRDSAHLHRKA